MDKLLPMDYINLLEVLSQWEGIAVANGRTMSKEAVNLKLKLEEIILLTK